MTDSRLFWVGFNHVKGIGAVRFRALLDHFGDAQAAWHAPVGALEQSGLTPRIAEMVVRTRQSISLEQVAARMDQMGITVLTWDDEMYPRHLKKIDQPPPVIYVRGGIREGDEWAVAVVGTRRVTPYGRQVTAEIASYLAGNGVTIVSGLARGVDAIAHASAIRAGGRTFAVLGNGLDTIYPPEHKKLADKIEPQGALISDYPPGTKPIGANFPPRNRIISGMSLATVVIEAGRTSGALITATFSAEQGRDVLAVPGNIHAPQSIGPNRLIQQGAHPVLKPEDILEVLNLNMLSEHRSAQRTLPSDPVEAQLFSVLGQEPLHVDELRLKTSLPIETITAALTMMELKGMARQVGGMRYVALFERSSEDQSYSYQVGDEK